MFGLLKNILKPSAEQELWNLFEECHSWLSQADQLSKSNCFLSMADKFYSVSNAYINLTNLSNEELQQLATSLMNEAVILKSSEGSKSYGIAFLSMYFMSQTISGKYASGVHDATSVFLEKGKKLYESVRNFNIDKFFE
jgi:hypothetical protein